jgi:hypothetical protein
MWLIYNTTRLKWHKMQLHRIQHPISKILTLWQLFSNSTGLMIPYIFYKMAAVVTTPPLRQSCRDALFPTRSSTLVFVWVQRARFSYKMARGGGWEWCTGGGGGGVKAGFLPPPVGGEGGRGPDGSIRGDERAVADRPLSPYRGPPSFSSREKLGVNIVRSVQLAPPPPPPLTPVQLFPAIPAPPLMWG